MALISRREIAEVYVATRGILEEGGQNSVAEIIVTDGPWHEEGWYPYMEATFAQFWDRVGLRPRSRGASPMSLDALESIAVNGAGRTGRVCAARAVAGEKPNLAKRALLRDYARFVIGDFRWRPIWPLGLPVESAGTLHELGVKVPREVMSEREARILLTEAEREAFKASRVLAAANAFNAALREMLDKEEWENLRGLSRAEARSRLLREFYERAEDVEAWPTTRIGGNSRRGNFEPDKE